MRSQNGAETNWCFMKFGSLFWPCGNHQSSTFGCYVLLLCLSVVPGEGQKGDPQKKLLQLYIPCCTFLPSSLSVCEFLEAVTELELGELRRFTEWEDADCVSRVYQGIDCPKNCSSVLLDNRTLCVCQAWLCGLGPGLDFSGLVLQFVVWFNNVARVPSCSCF